MNVRGPLRTLLNLTLSFSLAVAPTLGPMAHALETPVRYDESEITSILERASAITQNRARVLDESADLFAVGEQTVSIYEGHPEPIDVIDLDRRSGGRAQPVFSASSLKPEITPRGCLQFSAYRGADKNGENAMLVATHAVNRVCDLVAVTHDDEMFYAFDQNGELHVGDFGRVVPSVFTDRLFTDTHAVRSRAWANRPPGRVGLKVVTLGVTIHPEDMHPDALIPLDGRGQPVFGMGDLILTIDDKPFEIFGRQGSHRAVLRGQIYMLAQARAKLGEDGLLDEAQALKTDHDNQLSAFAKRMDAAGENAVDQMVTTVVEVMGPRGIKLLEDRVSSSRRYLARPQDVLALDHLLELNRDIVATARREEPAIKVADIEKRWPEFLPREVKDSSHRSVREDWLIHKRGYSPKAARERVSKESYYLKLARAAAVVVPFMLAPIGFERSPWLQQFYAANWIYARYPAVLKEASYRLTNFKSMFWLTALWPAVVATSFATGQIFGKVRDAFDAKNTRVSQNIRDFAGRWSESDSWPRLIDFGYRYYAKFILGPGMLVVDKMLGQPVLVEAFEKRMNPFARVAKDSPEGRVAGLDDDASLGVVGRGQGRARDLGQKRILLAERLHGRKRLNDHLHLLAILAAAQEFGVPMALIEQFKDKPSITPQMLSAVLTEPAQQKAVRRIHLEMAREVSELPLSNANTGDQKIDGVALIAHFRQAEAAAARIVRADGAHRVITAVRQDSKRASAFLLDKAAEGFWGWGKNQAEFLSKARTTGYLSDMVRRGYVIDHLLMVFLIALVGARANLAIPAQLAASATGVLWTSAQHWADMFMNNYQHFFSVSSRTALDELKPKPKDADYVMSRHEFSHKVPKRDGGQVKWVYPTKARGQGRVSAYFASHARTFLGLPEAETEDGRDPSVTEESFGEGMKHVLADVVSGDLDLGGSMEKLVKTQWALFFGYFTMNMVFRHFFAGQGLGDASMGMTIQFASQFFYLYTWWLPAYAINRLSHQRAAKVGAEFDAARLQLIRGLNDEPDPDVARQLRVDGATAMHKLFKRRNAGVLNPEYAPNLSTKNDVEIAEHYLNLANTQSAGAMSPNRLLPWIAFTIAAFGSTWAGVTPSAASFDPAVLNLAGVAKWLLWDAGLTMGVIVLFKKANIVYARQKIRDAFGTVKTKVVAPCARWLTQ